MKFYMVKDESDNVYCPKTGTFLVARELITEKEFVKRGLQYLSPKHFEIVEVKKNATHWFFGARFSDNNLYSDYARNKYHY